MNFKRFITLAVIISLISMSQAGPLAVGICYAGCAGVATACFAAAGVPLGVATGPIIAASAALTACNGAYAACYAACTVAIVAPTP